VTAVDQPRHQRDDWDQHWDDYANAASLNPAQQLRRRLVRSLLGLDGGPVRVLDIGCGNGDLLAELKVSHPGAELCGIDVSRSGLDVARTKVPTAMLLRFDLTTDGEPPPQLDGWATHATCSEVLEHVDEPGRLLARAKALLAPGCRLVVTVPGGPMSTFDRHIGHRQHFTPASLAKLLTKAGYEVEKATGVGFPLFNFYRLVVILRGGGLVRDVAHNNHGVTSLLARVVMRTFGLLFALGTPEGRWGWQIVAVARVCTAQD
jgi:2-polyprenyl-3-methyl-5-hydroxy-6-metoxy-1,4-benzoquinol methylase